MDLVAGLVVVACMVAFLVGVFMLLFLKGRRRRGGKIALSSVGIAFAAIMAVGIFGGDRAAQEAGFESGSDQRAAQAAGITDPDEWKVKRPEIEAAAAQKREAERLAAQRERDAAEEAARKKAEDEAKAAEAKKAEERRFGFHCLSGWDGSHLEFARTVKAQLRDPDSFEHVETQVVEVDDAGRNRVIMTFRARNGFGGMNVERALGSFSNATCGAVRVELIE
ncbi:hypothetical protein ACN9JG_06070 [Cereibacter azotoformans]|uniref:hypothetical protein n=1 Tax=Cereibacter azotoformans TaxID=43057 RepID=UPI003B225CBF